VYQNAFVQKNPQFLTQERDYLQMILTAQVYDVAQETPLVLAQNISRRTENEILLKREDLQPVFSFKLRGAYNRMTNLTEEERKIGVVACSAGNHAQGVALAARNMGIDSWIVMPTATPLIKVDSVQRLGGRVILHGADFDEAKTECMRISKETGRVLIHPYDDPYVIAGQGTIGVEILRQVKKRKIDAIFCCVGGGGLLAGISAFVKRVCPEIKMIGVEAVDAAAMTASIQKGERVELKEVGLFADGAAVKLVGQETFRLCKDYVDAMVTVTNDEICAAIKDTFEDTRSILEPAGALSLAGCKRYIQTTGEKGNTYVCLTSGANMNFNRLRFVAERAEIGEDREALLSVIIPERPGSFQALYSVIYPRNVTEFSYRYSSSENARIFIAFEVKSRDQVKETIEKLQEKGMEALDLTHNEMAKSHARYLVGGRSDAKDERLYRFEFPEKPGALKRFLDTLNSPQNKSTTNGTEGGFNVSLFHYRNHGADVGKVLAAIQVPKEKEGEFEMFLTNLGYPYVNETENPVYTQFLKHI